MRSWQQPGARPLNSPRDYWGFWGIDGLDFRSEEVTSIVLHLGLCVWV